MHERLIDKVREGIQEGYELGEGYFEDVYLSDYGGCMPEKWIGDDLLKDIELKFYYLVGSVRDLVDKELRQKGRMPERECATVYICPSYEDCSAVLVTFKKHVVYSNYYKAWHYAWPNETEMEEYLQEVYQTLKKNMEEVIAGRNPE